MNLLKKYFKMEAIKEAQKHIENRCKKCKVKNCLTKPVCTLDELEQVALFLAGANYMLNKINNETKGRINENENR